MRLLFITAIATVLATIICAPVVSAKRTLLKPKGVHPIVNDAGYLVGGTVDGKWMSAKEMARHLRGGELYREVTNSGRGETAVGNRPDSDFFVQLKPELGGNMLLSGDWNVLPRKVMKTNPSAYITTARAAIVRRYPKCAKIRVAEAISADLDGDGRVETLMRAFSNNWEPDNYRTGQCSAIILSRSDGRKSQADVVVAMANTPNRKAQGSIPIYYTLYGVWDLDGDGALEIVINYTAAPLESYGTLIYGLRDGSTKLLCSIRPNLDFKVTGTDHR